MVERSRKQIVVTDKETIDQFERIQKHLGIKNHPDVLRFLMNYYENRELRKSLIDADGDCEVFGR